MSEELEIENSTSGTSESIHEEDLPRSAERRPDSFESSPRSIQSSQRRAGAKTAQSQKNTAAVSRKPPASLRNRLLTVEFNKPKKIDHIAEVVLDSLWKGIRFTASYNTNLVANTLHYLRQPLAIFLCFHVLSFMTGFISQSLYRALSPICTIPGLSGMSVCQLQVSTPDLSPIIRSKITPRIMDYSMLMDVQGKSFEKMLQESAGGSRLSLEIKLAELATSDLLIRVRISDLDTGGGLAASLTDFIHDAKKIARGLQRLTSKIGGAVDNIIAVNDYSLRLIEGARAKDLSSWSLSLPWYNRSRKEHTEEIITRVFDHAMNTLSVNMERLILEADRSLYELNDLEGQLTTLHAIIVHQDSAITSAKSDLVEDLWTRLGGNRKLQRTFDRHLGLLKGLQSYKERALVHIVSTMQTLRALNEDMEDMRERAGTPELIGATVPVEVHMSSIQAGLDRLRDGRIQVKTLEDAARKEPGDGSAQNGCVSNLYFDGRQCAISL